MANMFPLLLLGGAALMLLGGGQKKTGNGGTGNGGTGNGGTGNGGTGNGGTGNGGTGNGGTGNGGTGNGGDGLVVLDVQLIVPGELPPGGEEIVLDWGSQIDGQTGMGPTGNVYAAIELSGMDPGDRVKMVSIPPDVSHLTFHALGDDQQWAEWDEHVKVWDKVPNTLWVEFLTGILPEYFYIKYLDGNTMKYAYFKVTDFEG
jgi:hypothetical protein